MANFTESKYESESNGIWKIRMRDVEAAVAGAEPGGAVTVAVHVLNSGSRRSFGLHPRGVKLVREVGTAPNLFKKYTFLALRSKSDGTAPAYAPGAIVAIGGVNWTVNSRVPEAGV